MTLRLVFFLTLVVVLVVVLYHQQWYDWETEDEDPSPRLLTRKRKVHLAEPLPRRTFRDPNVPEPQRSSAGTLIPLVVHVLEGPAGDQVASDWQRQGWTVRRWPVQPTTSLVQRYYGHNDHALSVSLWPYLIVYDQGGLFASHGPAAQRSFKNYLIYTGFDLTAVFFRDAALRMSQQDFAAQAHHAALQVVLEAQSWQQAREALSGVRVLEQTIFIQ